MYDEYKQKHQNGHVRILRLILLIILPIVSISFFGCGVLLHKTITYESPEAEIDRIYALWYRFGDAWYLLTFAPSESVFVTKYGPEEAKGGYFYIYIGTAQAELDSLPVQPFRRATEKHKGRPYTVYYYGEQDAFPSENWRGFQYMKVFIENGKVARMRGRIFNPPF
jgi:hypothetical protein